MKIKFELTNPSFSLVTELDVTESFDKLWFLDFMSLHWNIILWTIIENVEDEKDVRLRKALTTLVSYYDNVSPIDLSVEWAKEFADSHSFKYI